MAAAKLPRTFDATLLTEENKNKLRIKFNQKSIEIGGCRVWNGAKNSSGYPQTKVRDPATGQMTVRSVHRIVYSIGSGNDLGRPNYQVSHLCHNRSFIEYGHLNYETSATNVQRHECWQSGTCIGHGNEPACILQN